MQTEPKVEYCLTRAALSSHPAQRGNFISVQFPLVTHLLYVLMGLFALSSTALAQVEPALPGSIEYSLTLSNYTWVQTSGPITIGSYVEDLISDYRWNQPDGRGRIGIVTEVGYDVDYNTMAAMVDFGRDYSVGIVFPELSALQIVAIPEPATLLLLPPGFLLWRAAMGRRQRAKAAF